MPVAVAPELDALRAAEFSIELVNNDAWMVEGSSGNMASRPRFSGLRSRFSKAVLCYGTGRCAWFQDASGDNAGQQSLDVAARRDSAPRDAIDLVEIVRR